MNPRLFYCCIALAAIAAPAASHWSRVEETRTIRESVSLRPGERLTVDNLHGSLTIRGGAGSEMRLVAVETVHARSQRRFERARQETSLRIARTPDGVLVCADGPFREPDDCTEWIDDGHRDLGYRVAYEIELEVPRDLALDVRTIDGDIDIAGIAGDFDVRGVNGGVRIDGAAGSGRAVTVNGPVTVRLDSNPTEATRFATINGEIDVTFRPGLSADLGFETMNGEVLTEFEYELLPPTPVERERHRGRTTYKLDSRPRIRIGGGGPAITFKNINGDILVRSSGSSPGGRRR